MTDQPGQTPGSDPQDPNTAPPPPAPPSYSAPPPPPPSPQTPPQPSYGTPPPAPGYGAQPPAPGGYAPAPSAGYGAAPGAGLPFANWGSRVLSALIDNVGGFILAVIFVEIVRPLGVIIWLAAVVWSIYNAVLGGQTGQSYGKKIAGTRLVSATTGGNIGGGMGFVRAIAHIIDGIPCYLGYLWPLWDAKRQTFADKIIGTYVVKV
jgi:uncharacterized RDD family membrane protein YckC